MALKATTKEKKTAPKKEKAPAKPKTKTAIKKPTRVRIKLDVGFGNHLTIRGKGANLKWDKGIPLKNILNDEWIWETNRLFSACEFKILLNDRLYEQGNNHILKNGSEILITPNF